MVYKLRAMCTVWCALGRIYIIRIYKLKIISVSGQKEIEFNLTTALNLSGRNLLLLCGVNLYSQFRYNESSFT